MNLCSFRMKNCNVAIEILGRSIAIQAFDYPLTNYVMSTLVRTIQFLDVLKSAPPLSLIGKCGKWLELLIGSVFFVCNNSGPHHSGDVIGNRCSGCLLFPLVFDVIKCIPMTRGAHDSGKNH